MPVVRVLKNEQVSALDKIPLHLLSIHLTVAPKLYSATNIY